MNAEQPRQKELHLPAFQIPKNLPDQRAVNVFNALFKPKTFHLKSYKYFPLSGVFIAIGFDEAGGQKYE